MRLTSPNRIARTVPLILSTENVRAARTRPQTASFRTFSIGNGEGMSMTASMAPDLLGKILANLEPVTESGCLIWTRSLDTRGYGQVKYRKINYRVHRLIWSLIRGEIPSTVHIDHLCRVRCCANIAHL